MNAKTVNNWPVKLKVRRYCCKFDFDRRLHTSKMILKCWLQICILIVASLAQIQHKAVLQNDAYEQTLSNEFKNPFYKTARINAALKESSWLRPGEELVYERQAEKIPRSQIYSVLSHAGLIPRSRHQKRSLRY